MDGKKSLCKISVEAGDTCDMYLLCTAWESGQAGFDIALTDTQNAWTGTVSEDELGLMAKKMKVNFDEFILETVKALTRDNVGSLNFEYTLKEIADNEYQFTWKKYLVKEKIRIQLGQIKLQLKDEEGEVYREIMEHTIKESLRVSETIKALESDNQRLSAERSGALKRLERVVSAKEELENDLYSKFVLIVNDKKRKIRELRDELEESKQNRPDTSQIQSTKFTKTQNVTASNSAGESDDNSEGGHGSDYDTDEDKEKTQSNMAPSPTKKSKKSDAALLDTSDDLGLDIEEESPVASTRRRGRRGVVKKTPSKAIIPKVPSSGQKSKTPSGKPSLKKVSSHTSNQSNVSRRSSDGSCDDLLADL